MAENHTPEVLLRIGESFAPGRQEHNVISVRLCFALKEGRSCGENLPVKHGKKRNILKEIAFCCLPVMPTP